AEPLVADRLERHAQDRERRGDCALDEQVIERRQQLAMRQIAGSAENDECEGIHEWSIQRGTFQRALSSRFAALTSSVATHTRATFRPCPLVLRRDCVSVGFGLRFFHARSSSTAGRSSAGVRFPRAARSNSSQNLELWERTNASKSVFSSMGISMA